MCSEFRIGVAGEGRRTIVGDCWKRQRKVDVRAQMSSDGNPEPAMFRRLSVKVADVRAEVPKDGNPKSAGRRTTDVA